MFIFCSGVWSTGRDGRRCRVCFIMMAWVRVVNSSRVIISAYKNDGYKERFTEREFGLAAREAALAMREDINKALMKAGKIAW